LRVREKWCLKTLYLSETEKDGPLTSHITNLILTPTAYSKMR